jgi:serine/threonine protein kinase
MNQNESKTKSKCNKNSSIHNNRETIIDMSQHKKTICNNKFTMYKNKLLGEGSFGKVYLGKANDTNDLVAIKTEETKHNYLQKEGHICKFLTDKKEVPVGFSKYYWYGEDSEKMKYLVSEALGKSLQDLLIKCGGSFSLKTVIMIGFQILNRIEFLHGHQYIHRDIKPSNFLIGIGGKKNTIYLVDFGLSKEYCEKDGTHIEYLKNKSYVGTIRYMSVNCHKGVETARRDDMYSYIYMLFFLYYGNLPWQGMNDNDKKKRLKAIGALKSDFNKDPKKFFQNPTVPSSFIKILDYIRKMKFKQNIDYDRIREYLVEDMISHKYNYDYEWDWNK